MSAINHGASAFWVKNVSERGRFAFVRDTKGDTRILIPVREDGGLGSSRCDDLCKS